MHKYKLVVLLCPKSLDMNPMWICDFHLLIFYGFSSKLLEPQFKLDDLGNHFCNSEAKIVLKKINYSLHNQNSITLEVAGETKLLPDSDF